MVDMAPDGGRQTIARFRRRQAMRPIGIEPMRAIVIVPGSGTGDVATAGTLSLPPSAKPRNRTMKNESRPPEPLASAASRLAGLKFSRPVPVTSNVNVADSPTPIPRFGLPPPPWKSPPGARRRWRNSRRGRR